MPIQTTYSFNHSYPYIGKNETSIHETTIDTGLVVTNGLPISFGVALEGSYSIAANRTTEYQRTIVQLGGNGILTTPLFAGIALHQDKQPESSPQAYHTEITSTSGTAVYRQFESLPILKKGRVWAIFVTAVANVNPQALPIYYDNTGKFTTSAIGTTLATSVKLLMPTTTDINGTICGLVQIDL